MLANLQHAAFRAAVASEGAVQLIHAKEFYHWSHWRRNHGDPRGEGDAEVEAEAAARAAAAAAAAAATATTAPATDPGVAGHQAGSATQETCCDEHKLGETW
ncbi:hypothetical protein HK405_010847 [Cladochytrium tenue]|nr:hypothetical protein HK405_010847 [Cladochytrium tenue]